MPNQKFRKTIPKPALSEVVEEAREMIERNGWFVFVAILCFLDAVLIIGGLASKSQLLMHVELGQDGVKRMVLNMLAVAHVVGWAVGPPAWFFFETMFLDARLLPTDKNFDDTTRKARFERLKVTQDLGAKVWAGVFVSILFLVPK